jgi:hypothetical protein
MAVDNRAALAAHEALNRMADDVIAGRIDGTAQQSAPEQPTLPYGADQYAQEQYAQYAEPQAYQEYQTGEYHPDTAAAQTYSVHYDPEQPEADAYAQHGYTPEQQAAAEAYAAQFAESIGQTAVEAATQHQATHQQQYATQPEPVASEPALQPAPQGEATTAPPADPAPEPFVGPVVPVTPPAAAAAAVAAAAPAVTVVKERQGSGLLTYFAVILSVFALALSAYQGYVFNRSIDMMERNVSRGEFVRACRDMAGAYYEVKQKVSVLMPAADRGNIAGASRVTEANRLEAQASITKFGNLSNYLASFQDMSARVQYNELTKTLNGILDVARTTPLTDLDRVFAPADKLFTAMSDDCGNPSRVLKQ